MLRFCLWLVFNVIQNMFEMYFVLPCTIVQPFNSFRGDQKLRSMTHDHCPYLCLYSVTYINMCIIFSDLIERRTWSKPKTYHYCMLSETLEIPQSCLRGNAFYIQIMHQITIYSTVKCQNFGQLSNPSQPEALQSFVANFPSFKTSMSFPKSKTCCLLLT